MKKFLIVFLLLAFSFSFAQSINDYKYAVVPSKFSFLKENDQYRLNTLTKMFLEKHGFTAYLDSDVMPEELINMNCNKVYVDVISVGGFINTKLQVVIKDCKKNVLFTSLEGKSKEKEYQIAYNQALRAAFQSFDALNYKYSPKEEILLAPKQSQVIENNSMKVAPYQAPNKDHQLIAKPIVNGFELLDSDAKVVMKIYKTSNPVFFTAIKKAVQGILISKDGQWHFEYYENDNLISEVFEVKF